MIKCMPVVVAFSEQIISFKVSIIDAISDFDDSSTYKIYGSTHEMYGGGSGVLGTNIGEASLILKREHDASMMFTGYEEPKVVYLDGYIIKGYDTENGEHIIFSVEREKMITEACIHVSKAIWS